MTLYELTHCMASSCLPVLYSKSRNQIRKLVRGQPSRPVKILDIGGRKSPYTIGIKAEVTILDKQRESDIQKQLDLGLTQKIKADILKKRSNIQGILFQDVLNNDLPSESYDGLVAIEVVEHIQDDQLFFQQALRLLRPGGFIFLTTPNGDYIKNEPPHYNPDHVRHYTCQQLKAMIDRYFVNTRVGYAVKTGKYRVWGLKSMQFSKPFDCAKMAYGNLINHLESLGIQKSPARRAHLFAIAHKAGPQR